MANDYNSNGNGNGNGNGIDISCTIDNGKYYLTNCISNASGAKCMTSQELEKLFDYDFVGAVVSKSATLKYRTGNFPPRYADTYLGSINSMGIPNYGIDYYIKASEYNKKNKPYFISVSGLSLDENKEIITTVNNNCKFNSTIELNLSCPNSIGHPQIGYDFIKMENYISSIAEMYPKKFGIKLPPYFDFSHFLSVSDIIDNNKNSLSFITCINSIGNGLIINPNTEMSLIYPKDGFGGIGGEYIKPTALANVRKFYELVGDKVDIIGCGGILSGIDVFEHILCGAISVQIGTTFVKEGLPCFERITNELKQVLKNKNYKNLNSFRGKLKVIDKLMKID